MKVINSIVATALILSPLAGWYYFSTESAPVEDASELFKASAFEYLDTSKPATYLVEKPEKQQTYFTPPPTLEHTSRVAPSQYDMSWALNSESLTPSEIVANWQAWRKTQGPDNYAVKALGAFFAKMPENYKAYAVSEALKAIDNQTDYDEFLENNPGLFKTALKAALLPGELSEEHALLLTTLTNCRQGLAFCLKNKTQEES